MQTRYTDERTELSIEWNGSATFNVQHDGVDVDCFTVYGSAHNMACTATEAAEAAEQHFNEMTEEYDWA